MQPKISDEEFIKLWKEIGSGTQIAQLIGVNVRNVFTRRKNMEAKYKIMLQAATERAHTLHHGDDVKVIMSSRRDVNKFEINDGVVIIGSDAHYSPGHIPVAHKALCNLVKSLGTKVKAVILNGDIMDGGTISRHAPTGWKKPATVKQELEVIQERLGEIEKVRPAGCQLMRTYGNHDNRFESRLAANVPEFEGVGGFLLRDHIPHWKDSQRIDINDDCVVIHDWHYGLHSGWNDVLKGGCHTVTGHTHELSCKAHKGFKNAHYGVKTGMLADEHQDEFSYRLSKPGFNWQSGFAVLTWRDGMLLYPEFCAVRDDGNAYFRGELFGEP